MSERRWDWSCATCRHGTVYENGLVECAKSGRVYVLTAQMPDCLSYERRVVRDMPQLYAAKMRGYGL